jgi:hypothetical protein
VPISSSPSLLEAMIEAARTLRSPQSVEATVRAITFAATDTVPHTEHASISLVDRHGTMHTLVPTDQLVADADRLQCTLGEGPAWTPLSGRRWCAATIWPVTTGGRDMRPKLYRWASERRWPCTCLTTTGSRGD